MEPRDFEVENVWNNEGQYKKITLLLKGTVKRDFWLLVFSSFQPAWATDQWV